MADKFCERISEMYGLKTATVFAKMGDCVELRKIAEEWGDVETKYKTVEIKNDDFISTFYILNISRERVHWLRDNVKFRVWVDMSDEVDILKANGYYVDKGRCMHESHFSQFEDFKLINFAVQKGFRWDLSFDIDTWSDFKEGYISEPIEYSPFSIQLNTELYRKENIPWAVYVDGWLYPIEEMHDSAQHVLYFGRWYANYSLYFHIPMKLLVKFAKRNYKFTIIDDSHRQFEYPSE